MRRQLPRRVSRPDDLLEDVVFSPFPPAAVRIAPRTSATGMTRRSQRESGSNLQAVAELNGLSLCHRVRVELTASLDSEETENDATAPDIPLSGDKTVPSSTDAGHPVPSRTKRRNKRKQFGRDDVHLSRAPESRRAFEKDVSKDAESLARARAELHKEKNRLTQQKKRAIDQAIRRYVSGSTTPA